VAFAFTPLACILSVFTGIRRETLKTFYGKQFVTTKNRVVQNDNKNKRVLAFKNVGTKAHYLPS
jgi:hypothetical protein